MAVFVPKRKLRNAFVDDDRCHLYFNKDCDVGALINEKLLPDEIGAPNETMLFASCVDHLIRANDDPTHFAKILIRQIGNYTEKIVSTQTQLKELLVALCDAIHACHNFITDLKQIKCSNCDSEDDEKVEEACERSGFELHSNQIRKCSVLLEKIDTTKYNMADGVSEQSAATPPSMMEDRKHENKMQFMIETENIPVERAAIFGIHYNRGEDDVETKCNDMLLKLVPNETSSLFVTDSNSGLGGQNWGQNHQLTQGQSAKRKAAFTGTANAANITGQNSLMRKKTGNQPPQNRFQKENEHSSMIDEKKLKYAVSNALISKIGSLHARFKEFEVTLEAVVRLIYLEESPGSELATLSLLANRLAYKVIEQKTAKDIYLEEIQRKKAFATVPQGRPSAAAMSRVKRKLFD